MPREIKPTVSIDVFNGSFELEPSAPKPSCRIVIDSGKSGKRVSVGRFTKHPIEEVKGRLVICVLNFETRPVGNVVSEVLILEVQYPKVESGEATFVSPAAGAKIRSKNKGYMCNNHECRSSNVFKCVQMNHSLPIYCGA